MSEGRLLKIPEVAARLSISRSGVYRLMERGELRSVRIGRGVRFPPAEIQRLMNGRKEEPSHSPVNVETILETNADVESIRQAYDGKSDRPRPEWVRGTCPQCGEQLVSNCYYVGTRGYLCVWECWASLGENPTCTFRKVL